MKSLENVIDNFKITTLDGRDAYRLADFVPDESLEKIGLTVTAGVKRDIKEWTESNIKEQLEKDLSFAFEKALNKRGISANLMYHVVTMWVEILEDTHLLQEDDYAQYGLPRMKAIAEYYGFENPIGDMTGRESIFSSDG